MIGKRVIESKSVTLAEVANSLKKIKKEKELSYEQARALEHASEFAKIGVQKSRELVKRLVELDIPEDYAVMIVDVMPSDEEDVKLILGDLKEIKQDTYKKVANIVAEYM